MIKNCRISLINNKGVRKKNKKRKMEAEKFYN